MPAWLCFIMDLSRRAILNHNQTRTGGCSDRVEENVLLLLPEVDRFWKKHILWNRRKEKKGARTGSNYSNKTCRPEGVVLVADWEKVFLFFSMRCLFFINIFPSAAATAAAAIRFTEKV